MSATQRRTLRDRLHDAFFARDKATLAKIVQDAEEAAEEDDDDDGDKKKHAEPDGDEGDIHLHVHRDKKTRDNEDESESDRLDKLEDHVASLDKKIDRVLDHLAKDGELPEALKKHQFKKNGDDDDDGNGDETNDADVGEGESEIGAQSAEKLTAAEPDLMEADPSLKTGKSMMPDTVYVKKVKDAMALVVKDTAARAAVLAPGMKMATIDAATAGAAKSLCLFRRRALAHALATDVGRKAIGASHTPQTVKDMSCETVRHLFNDGSERMRDINNAQGKVHNPRAFTPATHDMVNYRSQQSQRIAAINKANKEFWANQTGRPN
jgi:hypothetical protein